MTRWWGGGSTALLVAVLVPAACSMTKIPLGLSGGGGGSGTGSGGGDGLSDAGGSDSPTDGKVIHCSGGQSPSQIKALPEVPSIMFAVDRSPSMGKNSLGGGTRYSVAKDAISQTVNKYTPLAGFGYIEFPGKSNDNTCGNCCVGGYLAPSFNGSNAISDTMTACWFPSAGQYNCVGSDATPSLQALNKIRSNLKSSPGPIYTLLLTDGPPTCATDSMSDPCDQAAQTVSDMFKSAQIATAVVAVGDVQIDSDDGGPPANTCLSNIANAGGHPSGTSRPFYYVANTEGLVHSEVDSIVAGTICHVDITDSTVDLNPFRLEVDVNGTPIPFDPLNGWTLSDARIDFWGTSCSTLISALSRNSNRVVVKGCSLTAPSPFPSPTH